MFFAEYLVVVRVDLNEGCFLVFFRHFLKFRYFMVFSYMKIPKFGKILQKKTENTTFRTAVSPVLEANYLEIEWIVPKTGLES